VRRFLLLLLCSACGLLAVGAHICVTWGAFYDEYRSGGQLDRELQEMLYFTQNWMIFYGVIYGLGRYLGRRLLRPEDLEEMAASRRWYQPVLLLMSGLVAVAAHLSWLGRQGVHGRQHWVYVLAGGVMVVWGALGLWSWWKWRRQQVVP